MIFIFCKKNSLFKNFDECFIVWKWYTELNISGKERLNFGKVGKSIPT